MQSEQQAESQAESQLKPQVIPQSETQSNLYAELQSNSRNQMDVLGNEERCYNVNTWDWTTHCGLPLSQLLTLGLFYLYESK